MGRFDKLEFKATQSESEHIADQKIVRKEVAWQEQAIEERRCGHYESALRLYSRALDDDKSLVNCWLGQVQMLVLLDEAVEAELWSRKALELFPGNGDLMAGRAQAVRRSGDTPQALGLSDGSLKGAGQSAYRWMVRGELMASTKRDTDRHCFDKATQLDRDWLVPLEIAGIYMELGNPSRALERIRVAVEQAPDHCYPWYYQGKVEQALGFDAAAARSWQHCLDISPGHIDAQQGLHALQNGGWTLSRTWRRLFGSK